MAKPRAPKGLAAAGRALWRDIAGTYELRPDEVRVLAAACREEDIIDRLQAALDGAPLTTKGSMGQDAPSPLLTELRQHHGTLAGLLKQLKLPDTAAGASRKSAHVSEQARAAARARWGTRSA